MLLNQRDTLNTTTDQDRWTDLQAILNVKIMSWKHSIHSWEIMKLGKNIEISGEVFLQHRVLIG